ncbi:MAG: hypothetical protein OXB94_13805 [Nitrospira sp.]|nr:hypothetical protein [Nitrospira sp.]
MTHFVFDTNVLVSALLFNDSGPGRAFFRALHYGTILIFQPLVKEAGAAHVRRVGFSIPGLI